MGHHNARYTSALGNKPMFAGMYTSDIVSLSLGSFIVTRILHGAVLETLYLGIGAVCIPLYLFLIAKNTWLSKGWFIFFLRSSLRLNHKQMSPKYEMEKKE